MTVLSVDPPFPIFTDSAGGPLENGYIWLGQANMDPQVNPISAYWDAALTQPAGLPIRTLAGYPTNNGTPARIFVSADDYSIRVQNKNGLTVYSSSSINSFTPSSLSTFIQYGSGAVTRTAQNKMRDIISVKDFGAVGDGLSDDTSAILNAILSAQGECSVYFPDGDYLTTSTITISRGVSLIGSGQASIVSDVSKILDITPTSSVLTTSLNGATTQSTRTITLGSVAGIRAGQILVIEDSGTLWPYDPRAGCFYGEVNIVASVNASLNQVTLEIPTATSYNNGVSVKVWEPIENINVENLYFNKITKTTNTASAITTYACKNAVFSNCTFNGFGAVCIQDSYSSGTKIHNCTFLNTFYTGVGLGYGAFINGSINALISNCRSNNARRCVDFSGSVPARYGLAVGCSATSNYANADNSGFGTHGTAQYCTFKSCSSMSMPVAFILRGADITVSGCSAHNTNLFATCTYGLNHSFIACTLDGFPAVSGYPPSGFIDAVSPDYTGGSNSLIVKSCVARVATYFVYINDNVQNGVSFELTNNSIGLRTTVTNFVQTANLALAKTFNIFVGWNNAYRLDTNGQYLLRMSPGTNATLDERILESWSANFFYTARRSAPPTTGTWRQGDMVWNTAPAAGGAPGWMCVVAGTPGTWKAMSNLAV